MKKRLITLMMSVVLALTGAGETIAASQISAVAESAEISAKLTPQTERMIENALPAGGLEHMQCVEIISDEMPEVYERKEEANVRGASVYNSEWDKYSTNFYYNQLTPDEKALWDNLDAMCLEYLTGTESVSSYNTTSGLMCLTKNVLFTGINVYTAMDVTFMFKLSNPQYYFLDSYISGDQKGAGGTITLSVISTFANGAARQAETAKMKAVIDSWMPQIMAQPTEWDKEKKAHDLICEKVIYDPYYNSSAQNPYNQVAYSVFCTPSTVCAGYSQAMQLLMNGAGVDCAVVTSVEHEWNIVRINGTWYYVDLTWDDLPMEAIEILGQSVGYQYFNRSAAQYANDDAESVIAHTIESIWYNRLPELTFDSGADWMNPGTVHTPAAALQQPVITADNDKVTITAPAGGTVYYTTDGTYPGIAGAKAKSFTGTFTVQGNTTINAIAVANGYYDSALSTAYVTPKYTVSFNANGGYIGKKSVKSNSKQLLYGSQVGKLPSPKKKGYTFLGWYTKKSGGKEISKTTQVTANQTYYARWAKISKKKASVSSVKNVAKGTMRVKIKNVKTASGYEIRYSLKSNMSSAKKKKTEENSLDIKKLKKGKTYYVQVRMFQKESVSGKKTYGPWSKSKTVKIKK